MDNRYNQGSAFFTPKERPLQCKETPFLNREGRSFSIPRRHLPSFGGGWGGFQ
ncbi:hypothetical protein HMPREF0973_01305 [Prevotella veroralis F0319]|uniref:Uncharacterized protein n=1 Tax=Prevotella veroralis F0319 TaxID=649761 RepID=C9MNW8_9BACT|nr:hypothetical protein HMPREF0973_01305 [Prevotella veroralis F0319]